jgi:hypothetical protein
MVRHHSLFPSQSVSLSCMQLKTFTMKEFFLNRQDMNLVRDAVKKTGNFAGSDHVGKTADDRKPWRSRRKVFRFTGPCVEPGTEDDQRDYNPKPHFCWEADSGMELRNDGCPRFIGKLEMEKKLQRRRIEKETRIFRPKQAETLMARTCRYYVRQILTN